MTDRCELHDHLIPCPGGATVLYEPGSVADPHARGLLTEPEVLAVLDVLAWDVKRGELAAERLEDTERWVWEYVVSGADRLTLGACRRWLASVPVL